MSMVETIARALEKEASGFQYPVHLYVEHERQRRWEEANPEGDYFDICTTEDGALESWKILATAALRAMETPTEAMKMAGAQAITLDHMRKAANYDAACDAWSAMIRAAKEG